MTPWFVGRRPKRMLLIYCDSGSAPVARVYPTMHNSAQQNYPNLTHAERARSACARDSFAGDDGRERFRGRKSRSAVALGLHGLCRKLSPKK